MQVKKSNIQSGSFLAIGPIEDFNPQASSVDTRQSFSACLRALWPLAGIVAGPLSRKIQAKAHLDALVLLSMMPPLNPTLVLMAGLVIKELN